MSSSIASTLMIIFIHSIFLLISTPTTASSSVLIEQACSTAKNDFGLKLCIQVLQSQPKVASAKTLFALSIQIIESGISRSTDTLSYMESLLKRSSTDPNLQVAVQDCKSAYDAVIVSLKSALGEVEIKEYQTATYDLLVASTDNIQVCERAMTSKQVKDEIISSGNKIVPIFGLSALGVVEKL